MITIKKSTYRKSKNVFGGNEIRFTRKSPFSPGLVEKYGWRDLLCKLLVTALSQPGVHLFRFKFLC